MDQEIIFKLSKFAMLSSYLGLVTVGACPAFGIIGIVIGIVLQHKLSDIGEPVLRHIKTARVAGIISLAMFPADVALAYLFLNR